MATCRVIETLHDCGVCYRLDRGTVGAPIDLRHARFARQFAVSFGCLDARSLRRNSTCGVAIRGSMTILRQCVRLAVPAALLLVALQPAIATPPRAVTGSVGAVTTHAAIGSVRFVGAVVVGTATAPLDAATLARVDAGACVQCGSTNSPTRDVRVQPFAPQELSGQIGRLERAGERIGVVREAVVTYR